MKRFAGAARSRSRKKDCVFKDAHWFDLLKENMMRWFLWVSALVLGVMSCGQWLAGSSSVFVLGQATANVVVDGQEMNATNGEGGDWQTVESVMKYPTYAATENLRRIYGENVWKNDLVLWVLPDEWRSALPHVVQSWLRNWILATALYFVVGGVWAYYCYYCFGDSLYSPGHIPTMKAMVEQMKVAFLAMPLYAGLPALTEAVVERGWTLSYARIEDVGLAKYCIYFVMYMTSVEFFVYWQHRLLHDIRPGYKYLHHIHHIYNKEHSLSPFAGLAFHPIDGILQAIPYSWTLLFVPMHFLTHELLLFATAVWTTNIHDCIHVRMDPIMGAGYHTIHHTTYKHNYGHYFMYMDKLMGTLVTPEEYEASRGKQH